MLSWILLCFMNQFVTNQYFVFYVLNLCTIQKMDLILKILPVKCFWHLSTNCLSLISSHFHHFIWWIFRWNPSCVKYMTIRKLFLLFLWGEMILRSACPYQVLGWAWARSPATLLREWWVIMQRTEITELDTQTEWSITIFWARRNPWGSGIHIIIEQRWGTFSAWPVRAWSVRAYKWYVSIRFWKPPTWPSIWSSCCYRGPDISHDEGISSLEKLHSIQPTSGTFWFMTDDWQL